MLGLAYADGWRSDVCGPRTTPCLSVCRPRRSYGRTTAPPFASTLSNTKGVTPAVSRPSTPSPAPAPAHAVQVLDSPGPDHGHGGQGHGQGHGPGAHVRSLTAGLAARGLRVTVYAPAVAETAYRFTAAGAHFAPTPPRSGPEAAAALRRVCLDADLVHAHGLRAALLAAVALRRPNGRPRDRLRDRLHGRPRGRRRTPLVVTWHTRTRSGGCARSRLTRLVERRAVRAATVVLGATAGLVARARRCGARDARYAPVASVAPGISVAPGDMTPHTASSVSGGPVAELPADPVRHGRLAETRRAQASPRPTERQTVNQVLSVYDELTAPREASP